MGGEEDGSALVAVLAHHGLKGMGGDRIKADEGLIHDDELRLVYPRRDDGKLLLHAVGICRHRLRKVLGEPENIGVSAYALLAVGLAHTVDISHEVQVFHAGKIVVQLRIIGYVGNYLFALERFFLYRHTVDKNIAAVKLQYPAGRLDGRGLARAVMADEGVDIAGRDLKAQVIHHGLAVVAFCEVPDFQHYCSSCIGEDITVIFLGLRTPSGFLPMYLAASSLISL